MPQTSQHLTTTYRTLREQFQYCSHLILSLDTLRQDCRNHEKESKYPRYTIHFCYESSSNYFQCPQGAFLCFYAILDVRS